MTALITGASGGIGEALARLIAAGGDDVVLAARSVDRLATLAGDLSRSHRGATHVIPQDLAAPDAVDRIADVRSFSEALTNETGGTGVTVTCLCPGPTRTEFEGRAGLRESRLFTSLSAMTPTDVARAGHDGMMAGRAVVVPGISNKIGVQSIRIAPRSVVRRMVTRIQERR